MEDVGEDEQALRVLFPDHLCKGKYTLIQMNAFCLFFFSKGNNYSADHEIDPETDPRTRR